RATTSVTRSVKKSCQRREANPVALADGRYSNGYPYWATTGTACESDRKCGARSGSALRAYAISRVRCPIPAPLLLISSKLARTDVTGLRVVGTGLFSSAV